MIKKTLPEQAQKVKAAVDGRIMHSDDRAEAILLNLQPGDYIPMHKNLFDVLFAGIEGEALLLTPFGEVSIKPGETIFVTSDEDRAWKNTSITTARIMVFKFFR